MFKVGLLILLVLANPAAADMVKTKTTRGDIQLVKSRHIRTISHIHQNIVHREDIRRIVRISASKHKVDEKLILAIMRAESNFNHRAVSKAGAIGLMQLMQPTGDWLHVKNIEDYRQNIDGGVRYVKFLLGLFKNTELAVAAYNAGQNAVISHGYRIPPYKETQNYVKTVMQYYKKSA